MASAEAEGWAQRVLQERAWPRTLPPHADDMELPPYEVPMEAPVLELTCMGMWYTLSWRNLQTGGTQRASAFVSSIASEAEFVSEEYADTNSTNVTIDVDMPLNLWRAFEKCIKVGSGSGDPWMGGVYPGRKLRYEQRPTHIQWEFAGGRMRRRGGAELNPMLFAPGWCKVLDPQSFEPAWSGAAAQDALDRVWLYETEFIFDRGRTAVTWQYEER